MKKFRPVLMLLAVVIILGCFLSAVSGVSSDRQQEEQAQLEDVLRRTAVACYAAEGAYPPDLEYMQEHYGIRIDETRYTVVYDVIASNLMPDITVLENVP